MQARRFNLFQGTAAAPDGRRARRTRAPVALVLAGLVAAIAQGQTNGTDTAREDLARELRAAVLKDNTLALEAAGLRDAHRRALAALDSQVERLQGDVERTAADLETERQAVEALRARVAESRRREAEARTLLARAAEMAAPRVDSIRARVAAGIPYRKAERLAALDAVRGGLGSDETATRADALLGLWRYAAEACRAARTVDLRDDLVHLDGGKRAVHAYVVRVGLASEFFVSEDAARIGLAASEPGPVWNETLPEAVRARIMAAVRRLQSRSAPRIAPVPFPVFPAAVRDGGAPSDPAASQPEGNAR